MPANNITNPILVKIFAKGQPLNLNIGIDVLKFKYEDCEKKDDLLEVTFADPFAKLIDSDQFLENTEWTVQWGFPQKLHPARKVLVKRPKFTYGEVEVKCLDKGSKLKVEESWEVEKNTSITKLVQKIAQKHGLEAQVDPIENDDLKILPRSGWTDWQTLQYLQTRAEDHTFKIESDKLLFQKRKLDQSPKTSFEYAPGRDSRLLKFEIEVKDQDTAKSSGQTTTVSVDPFTHKKKIHKSDEESTPTKSLGQRRPNDRLEAEFAKSVLSNSSKTSGGTAPQKSQGNSTGKSLPLPPSSDTDLKAVAESRRRDTLLDSVEANFEILASPEDPVLKSGDIIEIRGIGKKFSGPYYIIQIAHELDDNGYTYKIKANRNAVGGKPAHGKGINGNKNQKTPTQAFVNSIKKNVRNSSTGAVVK